MKITEFGEFNGNKISCFVLENDAVALSLINYGARIHELKVKKEGSETDVVLGCRDLDGYVNDTFFLGATIGRYANRIGKSIIRLNGKDVKLDSNEGKNILHGGKTGFHNAVWDFEVINENKIKFSRLSPDGESGFPGNLKVDAYYSISPEGDVIINYEAETDAATVISMTNHAYFNLNGHNSGDILKHAVKINSPSITEVDSELIPSGRIVPVDSVYDFRTTAAVGDKFSDGFDNFDCNYLVEADADKLAVEASGNLTGIKLKVYSDLPGVQFYSGKQINIATGKNSTHYNAYAGFCFEPQNYPDAPNHDEFPSSILNPGEKYRKRIVFSLRK